MRQKYKFLECAPQRERYILYDLSKLGHPVVRQIISNNVNNIGIIIAKVERDQLIP